MSALFFDRYDGYVTYGASSGSGLKSKVSSCMASVGAAKGMSWFAVTVDSSMEGYQMQEGVSSAVS